jgi:hypothetical protein
MCYAYRTQLFGIFSLKYNVLYHILQLISVSITFYITLN